MSAVAARIWGNMCLDETEWAGCESTQLPKFVAETVGQLTTFSAHAKRTHYLIRRVCY